MNVQNLIILCRTRYHCFAGDIRHLRARCENDLSSCAGVRGFVGGEDFAVWALWMRTRKNFSGKGLVNIPVLVCSSHARSSRSPASRSPRTVYRAKVPGSRSPCRMEIIGFLPGPKADHPDGTWLPIYKNTVNIFEIQEESVSIIIFHTYTIIWISFNREQLLLSGVVIFLSWTSLYAVFWIS